MSNKNISAINTDDLSNLLANKSDMNMAIAYAIIFWPQFVRYKGLVLFKNFDRKTYHIAAQAAKKKSDIEKFMNHHHLCDLLGDPYIESTPEQLDILGSFLKEMWYAKLKKDFPEKKFSIKQTLTKQEDRFSASITFWCR